MRFQQKGRKIYCTKHACLPLLPMWHNIDQLGGSRSYPGSSLRMETKEWTMQPMFQLVWALPKGLVSALPDSMLTRLLPEPHSHCTLFYTQILQTFVTFLIVIIFYMIKTLFFFIITLVGSSSLLQQSPDVFSGKLWLPWMNYNDSNQKALPTKLKPMPHPHTYICILQTSIKWNWGIFMMSSCQACHKHLFPPPQ